MDWNLTAHFVSTILVIDNITIRFVWKDLFLKFKEVVNLLTKLWIPMWNSLISTSLKGWSTFIFCIFLVRIEIVSSLDSVNASVCLISEILALSFKIPSMYLFKSLMSYNKKMWMNLICKEILNIRFTYFNSTNHALYFFIVIWFFFFLDSLDGAKDFLAYLV